VLPSCHQSCRLLLCPTRYEAKLSIEPRHHLPSTSRALSFLRKARFVDTNHALLGGSGIRFGSGQAREYQMSVSCRNKTQRLLLWIDMVEVSGSGRAGDLRALVSAGNQPLREQRPHHNVIIKKRCGGKVEPHLISWLLKSRSRENLKVIFKPALGGDLQHRNPEERNLEESQRRIPG